MLYPLALAGLQLLSSASPNTEWGRFRGPNGSGVARGTEALPDALGPEDHLLWRTELSPGYSSPVLSKTCVFVTRVEGVELYSVCLDRTSGEILWDVAAPEKLEAPHKGVNSPAAPTPVTDGENLYVFFEKGGGLLSYDATGKLRWSLEIGPFQSPYGMGTSPILAGSSIVVQCDHDGGSFLLAVDKDTGKERWRTPRPGTLHGFSTPILYQPEEGPLQLVVSSSYQVAGYSADDGKKLWWVGGLAWQAKSLPVLDGDRLFVHSWMASPTEFGVRKLTQSWEEALAELDVDEDARISKEEAEPVGLEGVWFLYDMNDDGGIDEEEWGYALSRSSAGNGLYAIALGGAGDLTEEAVLWKYRRSLPNIPSPLIVGGLLYILKEGGILTSVDLETGEAVHSARIEGAQDSYFASPVAVGARILTASQEGRVAVIEAGPEWNVLSVREFGEEIWATPAASDGQVFVRTEKALYGFAAVEQERTASSVWPHWRGPARDGVSTETNWKAEGKSENLWSKNVGLGYSAVTVADGRLYTLGYDAEKGLDSVWCLDAERGTEIWSHAYASAIWNELHDGGTLSTPTLDGETLFSLNREGKLLCFDAASGEVQWQLDVTEAFDAEPGKWGFAASPIVLGDELILNVGKVVGLDKTDGKLRWESENYGHSYSTPAPFELKGTPALAVFNSDGLALLDRADGKERYFREWKTRYEINAATPVIDGDTVFISSGLGRGAALLRIGEEELEVLWENKAMRNKMNGCVRIGEHLYGFDEAVLKCIDLQGEVAWSERGLGRGAVSATTDRLLVLSDKGELIVAEATPAAFKELSRAQVIEDGGVFWTTPVIVNGLIYVRGSGGELVCRDHR